MRINNPNQADFQSNITKNRAESFKGRLVVKLPKNILTEMAKDSPILTGKNLKDIQSYFNFVKRVFQPLVKAFTPKDDVYTLEYSSNHKSGFMPFVHLSYEPGIKSQANGISRDKELCVGGFEMEQVYSGKLGEEKRRLLSHIFIKRPTTIIKTAKEKASDNHYQKQLEKDLKIKAKILEKSSK